jgi:hypothetical protein
MLLELKLLPGGNSFRIVTPPAGQGAALKKNRGTDTGPIIGGKTLDIGYQTARFHDIRSA